MNELYKTEYLLKKLLKDISLLQSETNKLSKQILELSKKTKKEEFRMNNGEFAQREMNVLYGDLQNKWYAWVDYDNSTEVYCTNPSEFLREFEAGKRGIEKKYNLPSPFSRE